MDPSGDVSTDERTKNLLNGRLANSFSPDQINAHTQEQSLTNLLGKSSLDVLHDGSDIRKPYSKALPHLTLVKALWSGDPCLPTIFHHHLPKKLFELIYLAAA